MTEPSYEELARRVSELEAECRRLSCVDEAQDELEAELLGVRGLLQHYEEGLRKIARTSTSTWAKAIAESSLQNQTVEDGKISELEQQVAMLSIQLTAAKLQLGEVRSAYGDACQQCGRDNPVWFADSEVWNTVIPGRVGFLCPICFVARAEAVDFKCTGWKLVPENWQGAESADIGKLDSADEKNVQADVYSRALYLMEESTGVKADQFIGRAAQQLYDPDSIMAGSAETGGEKANHD